VTAMTPDTPLDTPLETPRIKRRALAAIVLSTCLIAAAYGSAFMEGGAPRWAGWLFAAGTTGVLLATLVLGAARRDRGLGRLVVPFVIMLALLGGGFLAVFLLPQDMGAAEPLVLGLPRRAAVVLYVIGLLPTLVLPVAYALTFADQTLRPEDMERVLAAARARGAALARDGARDPRDVEERRGDVVAAGAPRLGEVRP
jgi:hypothetical protein